MQVRTKHKWLVSLQICGIVLLCVVCGIAGGAITQKFAAETTEVTYTDFISILLTAISVLMTALALFLAVLGVIGWNSISSSVMVRTQEYLEHGFKEGNPLDDMLRERVTTAMFAGVRSVEAENEADDALLDIEPIEVKRKVQAQKRKAKGRQGGKA